LNSKGFKFSAQSFGFFYNAVFSAYITPPGHVQAEAQGLSQQAAASLLNLESNKQEAFGFFRWRRAH
jgi:hypothetical protein